jgi:hypothetical protein
MLAFLQTPRARLSQTAFLADLGGEGGYKGAQLPLAALGTLTSPGNAGDLHPPHRLLPLDLAGARARAAGDQHRSVRAGHYPRLAGAGASGQAAIGPVAGLLARPWGTGEAVFIKPTNHANMLAPAQMRALPQARAVLVTNPLPSFLAAVVRRGMMGRRWGRQLYLELMAYAGMDLDMDGREQFLMTDLQATALAWFLNRRFLAALASNFGDRVRVLDGDAFGRDPAAILAAVYAFAGKAVSPEQIAAIASGPMFARDAKTGEDYAAKSARDGAATGSTVTEDEIAKVSEWIGLIARQTGLSVPLKQTL